MCLISRVTKQTFIIFSKIKFWPESKEQSSGSHQEMGRVVPELIKVYNIGNNNNLYFQAYSTELFESRGLEAIFQTGGHRLV